MAIVESLSSRTQAIVQNKIELCKDSGSVLGLSAKTDKVIEVEIEAIAHTWNSVYS